MLYNTDTATAAIYSRLLYCSNVLWAALQLDRFKFLQLLLLCLAFNYHACVASKKNSEQNKILHTD